MIYVFIFLLGAAVGSFLNVLIDRLPKGQSITGRSHCDYCRHQLSGADLIPIVSFFLLKGRCRYCRKKLSWQYPLVETITGILFVLIFNFKFQILNYFLLVTYFGIISCLIVIFFADLKYQIIPDSLQVAVFIFSIIYHLASRIPISQFLNFLISGFIVTLPILFLWLITRGRGMGFGDVKLAFNIGFLLGIKAGFLALYFGFIIGAVVGLFLIFLGKKKLKSKIAFGPFLVLGMVVMMFWQKEIFQLINKIYGF